MDLVWAPLLGYLLGSLPFAVIVSRAFGIADPRSFGSGNPGATNVLRSGHKPAALLTLLGDAAKGWLAMAIAAKLGAGDTAVAAAGVAAFLGHVFPFTLRFKGGKGVATALGVLLGFSGWLGLATALVWLLMAVVFRYSSLASITAALLVPVVYVLGDGGLWVMSKSVALSVAVMSLVLLYRHAENINRLVKGTESKLGKKASPVAHAHAHGHAKHGHRHLPHADQNPQSKNDPA